MSGSELSSWGWASLGFENSRQNVDCKDQLKYNSFVECLPDSSKSFGPLKPFSSVWGACGLWFPKLY